MNLLTKVATLSKILQKYKAKKITMDTLPVRLWIESSLVCNLKCMMCPNKEIPNSDKGIMDLGLFKKIIDEAKDFASDINIHHRGEPLTNPNLSAMIRYAKDAGLTVRFHTNATLLDKAKAEQIIKEQPDLVSISFDGFQEDIYEEVRQGADFDKTVANIFNFLETKKNAKAAKPYTVVERIDFPKLRDKVDASKVNELAAQFKQRGLDELIIKKEYNWTTQAIPDISDLQTYKACTFPWYAMVICWDGTVTPCPQDYMAGINLGNVAKKSIKEIWNDTPYQELRKNLLNDLGSLSLCRKCDRLCRKQVAGLPFQYLVSFLCDHFIGYGKMRKLIGSFERN